ncbi:hypothetical protein HYH03_018111 [Edaphochlamys debaryana]|uniref:Uncharacterized protein n=1 Tax=Edaphochlamys debaryana TaxID=47281 RepID=A0A835XGM3_9CHLO|nr:hypothetical protein HYH03_018111 [Edaphochlamys debaryana]|eukprot:KAG2482985.1 hypothetical protein HYH03_018111 [Edaphochlamys debaryana]
MLRCRLPALASLACRASAAAAPPPAAAGSALQQQLRGMALEGTKGFSEGEKAIEDLYFTKEDERMISKLLAKVKQQSEAADKQAAEGVKAAEMSALKQILGRTDVPKDIMDKLLRWKHTYY